MTAEGEKTRQMPKGGRKGGAVFPRIALKDAVGYARKLVSKTHTAPQPRDVICSGVVGAKAGTGNVRISALKQYGFLKGDNKSNYSADSLAKQISAAPEEELTQLYRLAALKPVVFKKLFDTFHGDPVTKAKLKQRSADLHVHPDETENCVDIYIANMVTAGIITVDGDQFRHLPSSEIFDNLNKSESNRASASGDGSVIDGASESDTDDSTDERLPRVSSEFVSERETSMSSIDIVKPAPRAVFNVNITLDSSMDTEKLQKQLEVLRRYGAL